MEVSFTIPGTTVPWARAGSRGKVKYTPRKQSDFMGVVKLYGERAMAGRPAHVGPVQMVVIAVYAWPASWSAAKRARPGAKFKTSRPDKDNIEKLAMDALNGIAFVDDAQVADGRCIKIYGVSPRLIVRLRGIEHDTIGIE